MLIFSNKRVVKMFPKFPLLYLLYSCLGDSSKEKQIKSNIIAMEHYIIWQCHFKNIYSELH